MSRTEDDALSALYGALDSLRQSEDHLAPHHGPAWATVRAWIRGRGRGNDAEDIEQEALFAIMRNVKRMTAETSLAAAKWIATILKHKHIDQIRARNVDALDHGLRHSRDEHEPLDDVQADNEARATPELLEDRYARIEDAILRFVEASESRPALRLTKRAQGRAAYFRLLRDLDSTEVRRRSASQSRLEKIACTNGLSAAARSSRRRWRPGLQNRRMTHRSLRFAMSSSRRWAHDAPMQANHVPSAASAELRLDVSLPSLPRQRTHAAQRTTFESAGVHSEEGEVESEEAQSRNGRRLVGRREGPQKPQAK